MSALSHIFKLSEKLTLDDMACMLFDRSVACQTLLESVIKSLLEVLLKADESARVRPHIRWSALLTLNV